MADNYDRFGRNIDDAYEGGYADAERDYAEALAKVNAEVKRLNAILKRVRGLAELSRAVEPRATGIANGDYYAHEWFVQIDDAYDGGREDGSHQAMMDVIAALEGATS